MPQIFQIKKLGFSSLFLLFSLLPFSFLHAKTGNPKKEGSASHLKGLVVNCMVFISTENNRWTADEKKEVHDQLSMTEEWLINQATEYQVDLSFQQVLLSEQDISFNSIETGTASGNESVGWANDVMQQLGYKNARQAYRKLSKAHKADNMQLLIFAKADGMSYAMEYKKGMNKKKYLFETCLIYQKYDNGTPPPMPAVIAHEILHLYGGWDLYPTFAQTKDRYEKAKELYPNDIMLRVDHDMASLEIDKLTAWRLGWNMNTEAIFPWFQPK